VLAVSQSIKKRIVRWVTLPLVTPLLWMIATTNLHASICLRPISAEQKTGRVLAFHETPDGRLLVGAEKGLFRLDGDDLIGPVYNVKRRVFRVGTNLDGSLSLFTRIGVFKFSKSGKYKGESSNNEVILASQPASDGTLLVGTNVGLFRRDGDDLVPIGAKIQQVAKMKNAKALHILHKGLELNLTNAAAALAIHSTREGIVLVGAPLGLFRRDGDDLVLLAKFPYLGFVFAFQDAGDSTLVGGSWWPVSPLRRQADSHR